MTVRILNGDCRTSLRQLPPDSVHMAVTSPPYWGLRSYGVEPTLWGGDAGCEHEFADETVERQIRKGMGLEALGKRYRGGGKKHGKIATFEIHRGSCVHCGCWRGDLGLEPTPELFIEHMVEVFEEVRRVLRPDGTLWLNIGDSYASGTGKGNSGFGTSTLTNGGAYQDEVPRPRGTPPKGTSSWAGYRGGREGAEGKLRTKKGSNRAQRGDGKAAGVPFGPTMQPNRMQQIGLKPKDLVGIPWMLAFALRSAGWWLRQDIIWCLSGGAWLYARTATKVGPMMLKDLARLKPETVELWNGERWTRVVAWKRSTNDRPAVELVLRSGERIGCTDTHLWPTLRGDLPAGMMKVGDIIKTTRLPDSGRPAGWLESEAFWFAGLFLAEGSRSGETLQLAGHVREVERFDRIKLLVEHYGGSARLYNHKGNAQAIHVDSIALAAVVRSLIAGRTAKDKHLSPAVWHYRNWALKALVEGYLEGDGHLETANDRIRLGFCRNYALERDLRTLAARLGATLTLKPCVARLKGKSFPAFRGEWRWVRSGHANERDRGEVVAIRRSRGREFWDVSVIDAPNLFALASGVLTHNCKPNPMPESIEDRCTKAHEYVFLLSKSERYYFDAEAIKEESSGLTNPRGTKLVTPKSAPNGSGVRANESWHASTGALVDKRNKRSVWSADEQPDFIGDRPAPVEKGPWNGRASVAKGGFEGKRGDADNVEKEQAFRHISETRNKRSVWTVATTPFPEAHFATFPPALIEPTMLAGTSERGCCPKCMTGWRRVVAPTERYAKFLGRGFTDHKADVSLGMMQNRGINRQNAMINEEGLRSKETETIGWYPQCRCDPGNPPLPKLPPPPRLQLAQSEDQEEYDDREPTEAETAALEAARVVWRAECRVVYEEWRRLCEPASRQTTVPAVVLDPFGGSGTTGLVADRLQRDAVLCELKPEYVAMAVKRISGDGGLFSKVAAE